MRVALLYFPGEKLWRLFHKREVNKIAHLRDDFLNQTNRGNFLESSGRITSMGQLPMAQKNNRLVIGLGVPRFVFRSGISVESDVFFMFSRSVTEFGGNFIPLLDKVAINTNRDFRKSSIDLLLIDGNIPIERQPSIVQELLESPIRRPPILVHIGDIYFSQDGLEKLDYWVSNADHIVLHNSRVPTSYLNRFSILLWPFFPLPEKLYSLGKNNVNGDCLILGSQHRQRNYFIDYARKRGVMIDDRSHSRSYQSKILNSYEEYIRTIREAKMLFTNGYINRKESIIVGRAGEAFLAETLLLYEKGSDLSFFFSEYKSYLPVRNVHDFVEKVSYINQHPEQALKLTNHALFEFSENYSSDSFWQWVTSRI